MRPVFDSLESFFGLVALRAEALGEAHSWRMGKWLKHGALTLHEAMLRVRTKVVGSELDDATVQTLHAMGSVVVPKYPQSYPYFGRVLRVAEELREGYLTSRSGAKVNLSQISWCDDSFDTFSSTSRFHFHALKWVNDLLDAYELTGERLYTQRSKQLAEKWINECLYTETWPHVWDDHGTALRVIALCRLWSVLRQADEDLVFSRRLLNAIFRHGEKLAREGFYRSDHNHGVTQAYALLVIGLMFGSRVSAKQWAKLGRLRLEQQMARNVSSEGLHLEHSPYYHFYVFRQFYYAFCMARAYQFPFSEAYSRKLPMMVETGATLVKPNRKLAALGDTSNGSPLLLDSTDLKSWCLGDPAPVHSLLTDQKDPHLASDSALYATSGLAIFRHAAPEGSASAAGSYVSLRLGTFPTAHIHRDVFSFEFFAFGTDLIVDSGGPYAYGHPLRDQYFLATKAHNTVVVDDEDQEIGRSEVVSWRTNAEVDFLLAEHRNYVGVTHRRAFIFVKPNILMIIDKLSGERSHKYSQFFHLAPELSVSLRGETVSTANTKGGATIKLVPLLTESVGLQVHRGTERPYQGWVCVSGQKMEPAPVIEYSQQGKSASFAALIVAEPQDESSEIAASIQGRPFEEDVIVEITMNSRPQRLRLSANGVLKSEGA